MKFRQQYHIGDPDLMFLHVDIQLPGKCTMLEEGNDYAFPKRRIPVFLRKILAVKGITGNILIFRYAIQLEKGGAFSWKNVAPRVIEVMQRTLDPKGKKEILKSRRIPKSEIHNLIDRYLIEGGIPL